MAFLLSKTLAFLHLIYEFKALKIVKHYNFMFRNTLGIKMILFIHRLALFILFLSVQL